ncbi:hypothetical protein PR048_019689 [Dryococelus australis]|uniref:Uncharacterized protein n=1 Tax=Dryococelus australis TaxID=614101 RepID=A0ABQ9H4I6_9NEOP|nr:hypothetical protein PR048_019689 [Dryococelus australis]
MQLLLLVPQGQLQDSLPLTKHTTHSPLCYILSAMPLLTAADMHELTNITLTFIAACDLNVKHTTLNCRSCTANQECNNNIVHAPLELTFDPPNFRH